MARDTLTGSRIRERRIMRGVKQADLARQAGISASYLNLIEHNRRRIGGKLLLDIASILKVDPILLTQGAEATLIATLREAASAHATTEAELARVDEFAGRFPGWAQLLADSQGRIATLERTVETLTDRMTHDPHLATSLHEMLSTVTAIRSAASILAEPGEIDPDWQSRFHRNIYEDSARLAETSRGLVTYLESEGEAANETGAPQEEVDAVLEEVGHHVPQLETPEGDPEAVAVELGRALSGAAQDLLLAWLGRYAQDAQALPFERFAEEIQTSGPDAAQLAATLGASVTRVMRRLAAMPEEVLPDPVGLAICDASGVLTYRKPLPDFPMPRFGAACPLWPLYRALNRPMVILTQSIIQPGQTQALWAEALAEPIAPPAVNQDPLYEAHMLIRPGVPAAQASAAEVGVSCRICPRDPCPGRREPSILATA